MLIYIITKMSIVDTIKQLPRNKLIIGGIIIAVILFLLYRKHQNENMENTIGPRHTTQSGFAWW
jgi:hypothetical protein